MNSPRRNAAMPALFSYLLAICCVYQSQALAERLQPDYKKTHTSQSVSQHSTGLNAWMHLTQGFALAPLPGNQTEKFEAWLRQHPVFVNKVVQRAPRYLTYLLEQINARGMPTELALLPALESAYDPHAVSRANAVGMWQFIGKTAHRYGLKNNKWIDERKHIAKSTQAALDYLTFLHKEFDGDWHKAIAAYNVGERRMHAAIRRNRARGLSTELSALRLPGETQRYVPQLLALTSLVRNPQRFNVDLPFVSATPQHTLVQINNPLDYALAAQLAELSIQRFRDYNPAFKRRTIAARTPTALFLPVDHANTLRRALQQTPYHSRLTHSTYAIRQGDSLSRIAQRMNIELNDLASANSLSGDAINNILIVGDALAIPTHLRPIETLPNLVLHDSDKSRY